MDGSETRTTCRRSCAGSTTGSNPLRSTIIHHMSDTADRRSGFVGFLFGGNFPTVARSSVLPSEPRPGDARSSKWIRRTEALRRSLLGFARTVRRSRRPGPRASGQETSARRMRGTRVECFGVQGIPVIMNQGLKRSTVRDVSLKPEALGSRVAIFYCGLCM